MTKATYKRLSLDLQFQEVRVLRQSVYAETATESSHLDAQAVLPIGDQPFKHMSLWGAVLIQTTTFQSLIPGGSQPCHTAKCIQSSFKFPIAFCSLSRISKFNISSETQNTLLTIDLYKSKQRTHLEPYNSTESTFRFQKGGIGTK